MKLPRWLLASAFILFIAAFVGLVLKIFFKCQILSDIGDMALLLTLVVVMIYAYYTYLLAKDAWSPSASFSLHTEQGDLGHVFFVIQNFSKLSIKCWCRLNPRVCGNSVQMEGFYGGYSSFDLQPFGGGNGHFRIKDILDKASINLEDIKKRKVSHPRERLYFGIDFWYKPVGSDFITNNPRQPFYYDFDAEGLVADF
jgi:hypothetical protein